MNIVSRVMWGAAPNKISALPKLGSVRSITIHRTETPDKDPTPGPKRVFNIQAYHQKSRGFSDIGYHYLIGQDGTVYEGREEHLVGAHTSEHNMNNLGIAVMGTNEFPSAQMSALLDLVGRVADKHGLPDEPFNYLLGHREWDGVNTDCPGDLLMDWLIKVRTGKICVPRQKQLDQSRSV